MIAVLPGRTIGQMCAAFALFAMIAAGVACAGAQAGSLTGAPERVQAAGMAQDVGTDMPGRCARDMHCVMHGLLPAGPAVPDRALTPVAALAVMPDIPDPGVGADIPPPK